MINPLKVLLFLAGGTAVAAAGAYVSGALDPLFHPATAPAAVVSPPAEGETGSDAASKEDRVEGPAKPADQPATADGSAEDQPSKDTEIAAVDPKAPDDEPAPGGPAGGAAAVTPTFDLVRVETDGSMVIAGKAAPNAKVELLTGNEVIGSGTAGPAGDFVIVLDKPLAPGDYQITIRATTASTVTSAQTAIVSVPKDASGQVLAMIEEPGKPSEIITVPQPAGSGAQGEKPAAEAGQQDVGSADQSKPGAGGEQQDVAAADQPKPAEDSAKPAEDSAKPAEDVAGAAKPADGAGQGTTAPAADEAQPPAITAEPGQTDVAAANSKPEQPAATTQPATPAMDVAVEAVEIEGTKVFVAGRAAAGSTVRVYANELLLGETKTSAAGRFLVEAEHDLPVGSYIVRADVIAPDGTQVLARAAVPFEREPGENIAAVAPGTDGAIQAEPIPGETASADQPAQQPATPPASAAAQPPPTGEPPATAPDSPAIADATPPAADAKPAETATPPAAADSTAPAATSETPAAGGSSTPPATSEAQPGATEQPAAPAATAEGQPASDQAPSATADAQAPASGNPAAQPAAPAEQKPVDVAGVTPPAEVTAPPLQSVRSAVIIRRGDTLWRISKRVYGRGTRYSTIYLANQDQIRDPDRIWPGQVFGVPEKSQEGEAADLSKMGEQATTKPE